MLALDLAELLGLAVNLSGKIADTSIAAAALTSIAAAAPAIAWGFSVTNHALEADVVRTPITVTGAVSTCLADRAWAWTSTRTRSRTTG